MKHTRQQIAKQRRQGIIWWAVWLAIWSGLVGFALHQACAMGYIR